VRCFPYSCFKSFAVVGISTFYFEKIEIYTFLGSNFADISDFNFSFRTVSLYIEQKKERSTSNSKQIFFIHKISAAQAEFGSEA
jgi:hypothetical protein